ncbi:hypothetical protein X765_30690 [Mesorhizobium sp. LSHC440B00]|uniref:TlpA disulfide reductase family protein n=1 Tax=unclassified Mesorhizobium TaxID=325217 RepID=UPI0003CDD787|nr:hypothetical protein X765_30690 [Mesorhizobium sp. LSHC440B00]ESX33511.1 hypothetical protein X764_29345 [Mesorhizobium sp. LSHC440A00]
MPHLVQLQEKYKDSGLEVVGIAADEHAPTAVEAQTRLHAWLTEKCSNLNFRIAFDSTGHMKKLWMAPPSLSFGIPISFVVDRDGHVAFIGDPMELAQIFPKVLNGSWRTSDEAKAADKKRNASSQREARERTLTVPIYAKLQPAMVAEDWTAALSAVEEGLALPTIWSSGAFMRVYCFTSCATCGPACHSCVIDKKFEAVSWMVAVQHELFDPKMDNSHLPHAERFAMGGKLSEQILTSSTNYCTQSSTRGRPP